MMEANMGWVVSAIAVIGGFFAWYVKSSIKSELSDFRIAMEQRWDDRERRFDVKFQDAKLADAQLTPIKVDVGALHVKVNEVEDYSHKRYHELANQIQKCKLKLGLE